MQKLNDEKPQEGNPKKTLESKSHTMNAPITSSTTQPPTMHSRTTSADGSTKDGKESKHAESVAIEPPPRSGSSDSNSAPSTDIEKKMRRAERFGMPVQLSEQEKRSSRAERFSTGPGLNGSEESRKSEEQKRKARAERFGLSVQPAADDEEAKKKARLARFAPSTTSTLEEDKKKAREVRFSKGPSSSLSQVNSEGNIQPTTAIAGKASGGV